MAQTLFAEELKTRVSKGCKEKLESEAARRQVKSSHIVREALNEYLDNLPAEKKHGRHAKR